MTDRVVQYPNRYKLTLVSGSIYDIEPEPGTVTKQGTPLNKASLLKDQTAIACGLDPDDDPTVDDALSNLSRTFTAILAADDWDEEVDGSFTQTVSIAGMLEAYSPNAEINLSDDKETALAEKEAWSMVDKIETFDGYIVATCLENMPEVDLNIRLRGAY